jgi:hypothetical protein
MARMFREGHGYNVDRHVERELLHIDRHALGLMPMRRRR